MSRAQDRAYLPEELSLRRQLRVLVLLEAAADAGLEPVPLSLLHNLAYLSNALAPVWDLEPFDGAVLKRHGSPYYPILQWDVDRMVGRGLLYVRGVRYVQEDGRWRIDGSYCLNHTLARRVLEMMREVAFEPKLRSFCTTLAQAMSSLPQEQSGQLLEEDAAYGNPAVEVSNVVNLAENHGVNFAANAAGAFRPDVPLSAGERVHLYVNHLHTRLVRHAR